MLISVEVSSKNRQYWRLMPGAVVSVEVDAGRDRPVTITCHDHPHRYEFAWAATDQGPVIIDLRVVSDDATPITSVSLRRINVERLAKTAALTDTPEQAEMARSLRDAFATALDDADPAAVVDAWADDLDSQGLDAQAAALRRAAAERGPTGVIADTLAGWETFRATREMFIESAARVSPAAVARIRAKARGGGAGRAPREFYRDVATWARQAHAGGLPVYEYVREQATQWGRVNPVTDTIRRWIRRAEIEGFLTPGEIRAPKSKGTENDRHPAHQTHPARRTDHQTGRQERRRQL